MPQLPDKISGFRSKVINDLIDFCSSLVPVKSSTIKHSWNQSGVTSEVIRGGIAYNPPEDLHFRCEQVGAAVVRVHSGKWSRTAGDAETTVSMGVDAGTAGEYSGYKDVTITADTCWIIVSLDNALLPTTLTASKVDTTFPAEAVGVGSLKRVLAKVTSNATGGTGGGRGITAIEQLHLGDIKDFVADLDGDSLGYNASHKAETLAFAALVDSGIATGDHIFIRRAGKLLYGALSGLVTYLENYWAMAFPAGWLTAIGAGLAHSQLANWTGDQHNVASGTAYVITNSTGNAARNSCDAAMVLADAAATPKASISPHARTLYDASGNAILVWTNIVKKRQGDIDENDLVLTVSS